MGNKAVFLDRDGTLAPDVHYCSRPEDFDLFPDVPESIRKLNENGFKIVVITNQSGINRGFFTEETLALIHQKMKDELAVSGARIDAIYYCPHHPDEHCACRKPGTALFLKAAMEQNIEFPLSYVIGDSEKDISAGKSVGCTTILISDSPGKGMKFTNPPDYSSQHFYKAVQWILGEST